MNAKTSQRSSLLFVTLLSTLTSCAPRPADEAPSEDVQKVAKAYSIEVVATKPTFPVKNTHGVIDGKVAERDEVLAYAKLFVPEFLLYPAELVKRTKLERIVLCRDLSFGGQLRTAIPDYEHDTLYLDVARGTHSKPYMRKVIHHEFFHIIDFKDDGFVYQDERWTALNGKDFKYGRGGKNTQDQNTTSLLTDKFPGFLNHYSTTGVEEDKAELFANLIIDAKRVEEFAKNDKVLQAKIERLKELTSKFCPDVDARFWEKAQKLERADK